MKKRIIAGLVLIACLLTSPALAADSWRCTSGDQERIISVVYEEEGMKVPCEVQYQKDGVTETLWSAENEFGYCEEKAQEFVDKQREWGWQCDVVNPPR